MSTAHLEDVGDYLDAEGCGPPKTAKSGKPVGLPLLQRKTPKLSFESYLPDLAGAEAGVEFCSTECEPFDRT
jgi:hypothetical protein